MDATFEIPTLESLAANLAAQPEMALADAEIRARQARIDQAKAERVPDVKVELLYRRLEASPESIMRKCRWEKLNCFTPTSLLHL